MSQLVLVAHPASQQQRRVMQEWFGVGVMLPGYQWGEVGRLLHIIMVVVGLSTGLGIHGRQFPLTPILHNGRRVAVTKHVVGCTETVTVDVVGGSARKS